MKNRVRMIVVLVCVLVVLPVVGGLVYSFSVSAEAAARYYAEAIAQGRFEDAIAVEGTDADADSGVGVAAPSTCAVAACRSPAAW